MGLNHVPSIRDYFSNEDPFQNIFFKKNFLTERNFMNIHRKIHFDLDFIINKLNENFKKYYDPSETFVIDETMILFKGKFKGKQYIKGKPNDTGIKFYSLCDSNKYLYDFVLYKGKDLTDKFSNKTSQIVLNFVKKIPNSTGRRILSDNFYGSLELGESLDDLGIQFIFTCNKNRPSFLFSHLQSKLKKNQWNFLHNKKIMAVSFFDRKIVNLLSNCVGHKSINNKPEICSKYNKSMGFVDNFNQHLGTYLYKHRKCKWTKCALYAIFQMCLVNSWILYCQKIKKVEFKLFLLNFVKSCSNFKFQPDQITIVEDLHLVFKYHSSDKCIYCKSVDKNSNTVYKCRKCDIFLHPKCFELYHLNLHLKDFYK